MINRTKIGIIHKMNINIKKKSLLLYNSFDHFVYELTFK